MTVNFEHTEHFYPLHPHATAMGIYSVFADVLSGIDEDNEEFTSVVFTSIRYKVCSLLHDGEFESLNIPYLSNNREMNNALLLFTNLAIQKYESEKIERRNQTE